MSSSRETQMARKLESLLNELGNINKSKSTKILVDQLLDISLDLESIYLRDTDNARLIEYYKKLSVALRTGPDGTNEHPDRKDLEKIFDYFDKK